jgi:hypothetical protein
MPMTRSTTTAAAAPRLRHVELVVANDDRATLNIAYNDDNNNANKELLDM